MCLVCLQATEICPLPSLEWISSQVMRNPHIQKWALTDMPHWVETYLLAHNNARVRQAAGSILIALVPNRAFQMREQVRPRLQEPVHAFLRHVVTSLPLQTMRTSRSFMSPTKESRDLALTDEDVAILHTIYKHLLQLLERARIYAGSLQRKQSVHDRIALRYLPYMNSLCPDAAIHGHSKLTSYFSVMCHFLVSRREKLMFAQYFGHFWEIFHPRITEPAISQYNNKQALLHFWYQVCLDCPENVQIIVNKSYVAKNIAYIYIL